MILLISVQIYQICKRRRNLIYVHQWQPYYPHSQFPTPQLGALPNHPRSGDVDTREHSLYHHGNSGSVSYPPQAHAVRSNELRQV